MSGGSETKKASSGVSRSMENTQKVRTHFFIPIIFIFKENVKIHELDHYQQRFNWDCGLSCCLMVLNNIDRNFILNNLNCFIEEEGFGESTWTIDLCYILSRFKVTFKYTTITMGVDPGYVKENFYDKVLAKDSGRVNSRFENAESKGMDVVETTVTLHDILEHLDSKGPVIVLTNANLLTCTRCSNYISCYPSCFTSVAYQAEMIKVFLSYFPGFFLQILKFLTYNFRTLVHQYLAQLKRKLKHYSENSYHESYQGHYVVLVGYDQNTKEVLYRNPTVRDKVCHMPYDSLEESRTAYGTDEDVIFIYSQV